MTKKISTIFLIGIFIAAMMVAAYCPGWRAILFLPVAAIVYMLDKIKKDSKKGK